MKPRVRESFCTMAEESANQTLEYSWPPPFGYYWDLLVHVKMAKAYECGLCGLLSRDAVEMICPEHSINPSDDDEEEDDEDEETPLKIHVYCSTCLRDHLQKAGNLCPLTKHANPKWQKSVSVINVVSRTKIICPRTLQTRQHQGYSTPFV